MLTAVVGINWGDEGKGRMVDLLSEQYDVVVRYQGGNNAGHTVKNDRGEFVLNLLPSGILRDETVNVMGPGMVIDCEHLFNEAQRLREKGIRIDPSRLKISDKATICMPYHKLLDGLEEDRLADKKFGSTRRGIAPSYADKYMKKTIRMGDIKYIDLIRDHVNDIVEWKNLTVAGGYGYDAIDADRMYEWLKTYALPFRDYVCDTGLFLEEAKAEGKSIMFEAQLGALKDIDFGIFPYTSSSSTIASYAPIGAGIPQERLDSVVGIMKAYSSAVGEGPFTAEFFGKEADDLREAGGEYGAATGRPRRVGAFDIPASAYGIKIQGATEIALTKLDVLSYMDSIPVCTHYEVDGQLTDIFPTDNEVLSKARPVYKYLPGFRCDISKVRDYESLPQEAKDYIKFIEEKTKARITYISVGPGRDEYIKL